MINTEQERPIALKEWAVAVKALAEGKQIIVLRKGGIAEETREFQLVTRNFYLLPAYEHQKPELLKDGYRDGVKQTLADWRPGADTVRINAFAEAVQDIEIRDQESLDRIREYHIWTDMFAEERLKWKKTKPLHLLLLRVSVLQKPVDIPMRETYTGCKSWVTIEDGIPAANAKPVLTDEVFDEQASQIRKALGL